jgi:hypothetical protein
MEIPLMAVKCPRATLVASSFMTATVPKSEQHSRRGSFPLASLALLVTVFAAALACTDLGRWNRQYAWLSEHWPWRLVALLGGVGLFGGLIGIAHLFLAGVKGRARWIAPIAGVLAGEVGVLILVAPGPIWRTLFAISVMLGTTILLRLGAE